MLRTILVNFEDPSPTTWFYLSFLLTLAVFFKFTRLWSLRNLDLLLLLLLTPGVLLVARGTVLAGLIWLLIGSAFLLIRLLIDPLLSRRPVLEPNLNVAGLTFLAASLLAFLMDSVVGREPSPSGIEGARWAQHLIDRQEMAPEELSQMTFGPSNGLLHALTYLPARGIVASLEPTKIGAEIKEEDFEPTTFEAADQMLVIVAHLSVIVALVVCCRVHFGNTSMGVAAATLYLLLPYTSYQVASIEHVLPASLFIWAIVACRRPLVAGILLAMATGFTYCLVFLLPIWISYYGRARAVRLGIAYGTTLGLLAACVVLTSTGAAEVGRQLAALVSWNHWQLNTLEPGAGIWSSETAYHRIPVFVGFLVLTTALVLRPTGGRFTVLLSGTAAVVLTTQFWYAHASGLFISWYLPLFLLTMFRPTRSVWLAAEETPNQTHRRVQEPYPAAV